MHRRREQGSRSVTLVNLGKTHSKTCRLQLPPSHERESANCKIACLTSRLAATLRMTEPSGVFHRPQILTIVGRPVLRSYTYVPPKIRFLLPQSLKRSPRTPCHVWSTELTKHRWPASTQTYPHPILHLLGPVLSSLPWKTQVLLTLAQDTFLLANAILRLACCWN